MDSGLNHVVGFWFDPHNLIVISRYEQQGDNLLLENFKLSQMVAWCFYIVQVVRIVDIYPFYCDYGLFLFRPNSRIPIRKGLENVTSINCWNNPSWKTSKLRFSKPQTKINPSRKLRKYFLKLPWECWGSIRGPNSPAL